MIQYNEKMLVIACCEAEGQYLPLQLFLKAFRKIKIADGLLPGSTVFMNETSSYTGTDIFFR